MAIGNPVAFDASADERETRGFISMTASSRLAGSYANCTFAPPVATPTARAQANAASRRRWYSASGSVCWGATVHESPVWTPIGSRFSIEQTTTQLPAMSIITSSSCSCQPSRKRSTNTWPIGLTARPRRTSASSSSRSRAMPPPVPPRVNAGRTTAGKLTPSSSSADETTRLSGTGTPAAVTAARNASRSSARRIASTSAPINSTPKRDSTPASASSTVRFSAVCPPSVGSSASGRSRSMISATVSASNGSRYVASAHSGSVMIVAGFELTSTTR